MALSANTCWEVRTVGNDTNGGGFVAGSGGTDYSQQAAAQVAVTDLVCNNTTTVVSATAGFTSAMVGNTCYITGGTGSITAARYQIVTFTNSTTVVLDRSTGLGAGTGGTLNLGGAIATFAELASARGMIGSNKAFIKADGTYTCTASNTFSINVSGGAPTTNVPFTKIIGYTSVRGDAGYATLSLQTNTGITGMALTGAGIEVRNIIVNCNSLGTSRGIDSSGSFNIVSNCKALNFTTLGFGFRGTTRQAIFSCEATGGGSGAVDAIDTGGGNVAVMNCWVHDNACTGISTETIQQIFCINNIVANCSGATSDGIFASSNSILINNTIYNCGRHGIFNNTAFVGFLVMQGNILSSNGGFGIVGISSNGMSADPMWDGNAFYNNTSGTRSNIDDTTANPIDGVSPYVNIHDVILTADPFVAKASNDFRLNTTAGGGAACRAAGLPQGWTGLTNPISQPFPDMGAVQSQSSIVGYPTNWGFAG